MALWEYLCQSQLWYKQIQLPLQSMGAGVANGRVQFCPCRIIFAMKAECIVLQPGANVSWKVLCRDTGPEGSSDNALTYLVMVLNELMQKSCNTRDGRWCSVSLCTPCYAAFSVKILPKASALKSPLFCYTYHIILYISLSAFFLPLFSWPLLYSSFMLFPLMNL